MWGIILCADVEGGPHQPSPSQPCLPRQTWLRPASPLLPFAWAAAQPSWQHSGRLAEGRFCLVMYIPLGLQPAAQSLALGTTTRAAQKAAMARTDDSSVSAGASLGVPAFVPLPLLSQQPCWLAPAPRPVCWGRPPPPPQWLQVRRPKPGCPRRAQVATPGIAPQAARTAKRPGWRHTADFYACPLDKPPEPATCPLGCGCIHSRVPVKWPARWPLGACQMPGGATAGRPLAGRAGTAYPPHIWRP